MVNEKTTEGAAIGMKNIKQSKADLYREERENGLNYQQIADKYGVSKQCVAQACGKQDIFHFQYNNTCVYPGLRKWINDNKISTSELVRLMGMTAYGQNCANLRNRLNGETELKKSDIDKLIEITGMTYDKLFREKQDGNERTKNMDAVEVVHGRRENGRCTNCGHYGEVQNIGFTCTGKIKVNYKQTNYCSNCGADLRERKDNAGTPRDRLD